MSNISITIHFWTITRTLTIIGNEKLVEIKLYSYSRNPKYKLHLLTAESSTPFQYFLIVDQS